MKKWNISQTLKYNQILKFLSLSLILTVLVTASCSDDDDSSSGAAKAPCTLTKETTTTTGKEGATTFTQMFVSTHGYDAAGNLTSQSFTYDYAYSDGTKSSAHNNVSMQYDSKGFLLRSLRQYGGTDRSGKVSNSNQNDDYTYENERLIKDATQWSDNGTDRSYITTYEYNAAGKIIKTFNTYNNYTTTFQYDGDAVSKITTTNSAGISSSPFIQYDGSGRVIKSIDTSGGISDENRYEYNTEGLLAKEERYINGKPNHGNIYEYDTKKNPYTFVYAKQKGFPVIPTDGPDYPYVHNYTKITTLSANDAGTALVTTSTTTYIYDYNAKDLPSGVSSKALDSKGAEMYSTTIKYEYSDCQ